MQQKGNVEWKVAGIRPDESIRICGSRGTARSAIVICQSSSFVKSVGSSSGESVFDLEKEI